MKPQPVKRKHSKTSPNQWAYNVLGKARQEMGDEAFLLMVQQQMIDINLQRALNGVHGIDERGRLILQAYEMRSKVKD